MEIEFRLGEIGRLEATGVSREDWRKLHAEKKVPHPRGRDKEGFYWYLSDIIEWVDCQLWPGRRNNKWPKVDAGRWARPKRKRGRKQRA